MERYKLLKFVCHLLQGRYLYTISNPLVIKAVALFFKSREIQNHITSIYKNMCVSLLETNNIYISAPGGKLDALYETLQKKSTFSETLWAGLISAPIANTVLICWIMCFDCYAVYQIYTSTVWAGKQFLNIFSPFLGLRLKGWFSSGSGEGNSSGGDGSGRFQPGVVPPHRQK